MQSSLILQNLIWNLEYSSKVLPYLKKDFFATKVDQVIFDIIQKHSNEYSEIPTFEVIVNEVRDYKGFTQDEFNQAKDVLVELKRPSKTPDSGYLLNETEKFCLHQSAYNAVLNCVDIINGTNQTPISALPEILKDAVAINFDTAVGHDYAGDIESRYAKLHEVSNRIPSDITGLNKILGGGFVRKSLVMFMGQPGGGKSMVMTHLGTKFYQAGLNVLYITLELSEERIGERIDANILQTPVGEIPEIPLDTYKAKIEKRTGKLESRFFVKEYPPTSVSTAHLRALLDELKLKKEFEPDILIVDYLNLLGSSRYKPNANNNSYTILKAVAEELRGLAVERNLVCISATQMNRGAVGSSDVDMTATSESMGIPMTVDALIAIIRSEELDDMKQMLFKCLKTRYSDFTNYRFVSGMDMSKMTLFNVDDQSGIQQTSNNTPKPQMAKPSLTKPGKRSVEIEV